MGPSDNRLPIDTARERPGSPRGEVLSRALQCREQRGEQLNAIPKVLETHILVRRVGPIVEGDCRKYAILDPGWSCRNP